MGLGLSKLTGISAFLTSLMGMMRTQSLRLEQDGCFTRKKVCNPPIGRKMKMVNGLRHNKLSKSDRGYFCECFDVSNCSGIV